MSESYLGEIRMFGGNFAPNGWLFCEGQLLPIEEYDALFALIGTTYGGDGETNFALPDLRGRIPVHQGSSGDDEYQLGQSAGVETVTLTVGELPAHTHDLRANDDTGDRSDPNESVPAHASRRLYGSPSGLSEMASSAIQPVGADQPHSNVQPYLCISFIISTFGVFPTQN